MDDPKKKKPGFFSRLFSVTKTEEPEPAKTEASSAPVAPAAEPDKRPGFFGRLFGKTEQQETPKAEPVVPASDSGEQIAPAPATFSDDAIPVAKAPENLSGSWYRPPMEEKSWFQRLTDRLDKTRRSLVDNVRSILGFAGKLDDATIEELEAALIQGDVSVETTQKILKRMRTEAKSRDRDMKPGELLEIFKESVRDILANSAPGFDPKPPADGPYIVMVVGVNGVGKTTTIAKMAKRCTGAGLKTMLVAGDTFRAAAVEQLEIWAKRTGAEFVRGPHGSDAAALCYDALNQAKARGMEVVFIDTAGRLHTKGTLMAELSKMERVIAKQYPDAPHETLLVLDATTGQNAIQQVRIFSECVRITGLVLTKLDGTAKGGILLSILDMFHIPITLIGVGESADDLRDFDPDLFAQALFGEEEPTRAN